MPQFYSVRNKGMTRGKALVFPGRRVKHGPYWGLAPSSCSEDRCDICSYGGHLTTLRRQICSQKADMLKSVEWKERTWIFDNVVQQLNRHQQQPMSRLLSI